MQRVWMNLTFFIIIIDIFLERFYNWNYNDKPVVITVLLSSNIDLKLPGDMNLRPHNPKLTGKDYVLSITIHTQQNITKKLSS